MRGIKTKEFQPQTPKILKSSKNTAINCYFLTELDVDVLCKVSYLRDINQM